MTHVEIIQKLVGEINPIGETNTDNERFENLKTMCDLIESLISEIDAMAYKNNNAYEYSRKRASDYVKTFMTKNLGISE